MAANKRLLVINYYFPPLGGAGVKRSLKLIKFLPMNGWDPIVLTVKNGNHHLTDFSLLQEISSEVPVHRAFTLECLFNKGIETSPETIASSVHDNSSGVIFIKRWLKKAYKFLGQFMQIPDSRILWLPGAIIAGIKLSLQKQFDVIYATGPTFSSLVIGALLKTICRKPLIVDFRDAWMSDPMLHFDRKYLVKINALLEKFVIKTADKVISTNPFVTQDFRKRYCEFSHSKFDTIYNGFDMDDYAFLKGYTPRTADKFTIVHTGRLYNERTPKYFLEALRDALDDYPNMRRKLQVILVGPCETFFDGKHIETYVEEFNLRDVVKLTGQIPRNESFEYQMIAHLLLLIVGIVPQEKCLTYGIPGKIFDYVVSRKSVLTLANEGPTRQFIITNKIGSIYYHNDLKGIREYLVRSYKKFQSGIIENPAHVLTYQAFDFRVLTQKFCAHLNHVIKHKG